MEGEVVTRIAELAQAQTEKYRIGPRDVLVHAGTILEEAYVEAPLPDPLNVHSLTGLRDYLVANRDGLRLPELVVHVVSPTRVQVLGPPLATLQRAVHLRAECYDRFAAVAGFKFGAFLSHEAMVIALHALFAPALDRDTILRLLANIEQGVVRTDADDGIAQAVTVRTGISLAAERVVPNPVLLRPYRTFTEITQPESTFVFRLKHGAEAQQAGVALFEADGGAWRDEATARIRDWLVAQIPVDIAVLA